MGNTNSFLYWCARYEQYGHAATPDHCQKKQAAARPLFRFEPYKVDIHILTDLWVVIGGVQILKAVSGRPHEYVTACYGKSSGRISYYKSYSDMSGNFKSETRICKKKFVGLSC